jgi:hypothetical protein
MHSMSLGKTHSFHIQVFGIFQKNAHCLGQPEYEARSFEFRLEHGCISPLVCAVLSYVGKGLAAFQRKSCLLCEKSIFFKLFLGLN